MLVREGFSEVTVEGYRRVLERFLKGNQTAEEYVAEMRRKGYSFSHIRNTTVALEKYLNFIGKPIKLARLRRPKPIIKDTLTEGEIARMLAACKNSREQVILAVLAYSGIRNKELCNLRVGDVDLDDGVLKIIEGKGNRDRIAYISRECCKIISEYLRDYSRGENEFLVTTVIRNNQYQSTDLRKTIKVVARRAKIKKRVYPHLFRHSLAVNLLQRGANIMSIQQILGHLSLQSTLIYAHSLPQKVQNEYQFYAPNYV